MTMSADGSSVGILYIATGKYERFWDSFFESSERYFLGNSNKHYFVFSDNPRLLSIRDPNVTPVRVRHRRWPYITLLRYELFLSVIDELERFDYLFFFNANIQFVRPACEADFFPDTVVHNGLVGVLHPGYFRLGRWRYPYERKQKQSTAYMPWWSGRNYLIGGINGGTRSSYSKLIRTLSTNIRRDLDNRIVAIWHDESHLNAYFDKIRPKILSPEYAYAEGWALPFTPRILIRDKSLFGGHKFLRETASPQVL